jgi:hypothetical protein
MLHKNVHHSLVESVGCFINIKIASNFFSCAKTGSSQVGGVFMTISCICNGITVVSRVGCIVRNATQERSSFSRVDSVGCFINKKNS